MAEQQYDYSREPARHDSGEWSEQAPPAAQAHGPRRPQRVEISKPFRTGIFLGFGFMVAWLIVAVVFFAVSLALGVGLAGLTEGVRGGIGP
jgi:hypothetical protein